MTKSLVIKSIMPQSEHEDPIHCWQEQIGHESELEIHGLIARLVNNCLDSLNCLSQDPTSGANVQSRKDCNALRRCLSMLRLWAKGYGALTGELDALLDRSKNLRQTILVILHPMCKALAKALRKQITQIEEDVTAKTLFATAIELCDQTRWLLTDINDSSSGSESDSESDASSSEDECTNKANGFVQDIKTYTNCLIDLGPALDCPALEPRQEDTPGLVTSELRFADGYYTELIRAKYPQAKASLLQHLGEASWDRYQRMQKEREVNALEVVTLTSSEKSQIAESEFQDSGIGTSLPQTPSSYAETIVSFMTSISGGQRLNIPPLPAEAKNGLPFECNACGRHIKAASNREWRKHLYADLRPYTCLFEHCTFTKEPFANRQLWSGHLELEHGFGPDWHSIECPLCRELTPNGRSAIIIHFSRHMEDIALASLPRDVESEADTDTDASSQLTSVSEPESTSDGIEATHNQQSTKDGVANAVNDPQTEIEQLHNKIEDNFQQLVKLRAATTHVRQAVDQRRFDYNDFVNLKAGSDPSKPLKAKSEGLRRLVTIQENEMLALKKQIALDNQLENKGLKLPVDRNDSYQDSSRVGPEAETYPTRVSLDAVVLQAADGSFFCSDPSCGRTYNRLRDCRRHINKKHRSDWSATELQWLETLIAHFGTDFYRCSQLLRTKTPAVIEIQYQRMLENGNGRLEQAARNADAKRMRGDEMGPPPAPPHKLTHETDSPRLTTPRDAHDWGQAVFSSGKAIRLNGQPEITSKAPSSGQFEGQPAHTTERFEVQLPPTQLVLNDLAAQESGLGTRFYAEPRLPKVLYTKTGRISKAKTGLRVHQCDCGKTYTRAAHLRRHQKIHAREEVLVCKYPTCGKTFYRADLLHRHEERHNELEPRSRQRSADFTHRRSSVDLNSPVIANFEGYRYPVPYQWSRDSDPSESWSTKGSGQSGATEAFQNPKFPVDSRPNPIYGSTLHNGQYLYSEMMPSELRQLTSPPPEGQPGEKLPSIQELQLPQQSIASPSQQIPPSVLYENPVRSTADVVGTSSATPCAPTIDPKVPPRHPVPTKLLSNVIHSDPSRSAQSQQSIGMSKSHGSRSQLARKSKMPMRTTASMVWACSDCAEVNLDIGIYPVCPTCSHTRCDLCVTSFGDVE